MNILFLHQNFPGQFRHIAAYLAKQPGYRVLAIAKKTAPGLEGVRLIRYDLHREPSKQAHHYVRPLEAGVLHGQAVARVLLKLKAQGFVPDVVIAHPGWGEALYVKDVFPHTRLISFFEFFYHPEGADCGFDPEFPVSFDDRTRIRSKNALHLMNLEACDIGISPTQWQKSLHPTAYHHKIEVIHEGIDTDTLRPDPEASFTLPNGVTLHAGQPVVTYVARNLEPYRGFHSFMRCLPQLLQQHPTCQVLIVGGDDVSYGSKPKDAANWREKLQGEVELDPTRVHFLGRIPYDSYRKVLQISAAHVYLTYPFVLSWSMLEAMASGCLVIGSATPPVQEVIRHQENGLLVDFFDISALANTITHTLQHPGQYQNLRQTACEQAHLLYSHKHGLAAYLRLIHQ